MTDRDLIVEQRLKELIDLYGGEHELPYGLDVERERIRDELDAEMEKRSFFEMFKKERRNYGETESRSRF